MLGDLVLASGPDGLVGETSQDALAKRWGAAWAIAHSALGSLARAGALSAPFCRGQRVTLAVTAKAALVRPPGRRGRPGRGEDMGAFPPGRASPGCPRRGCPPSRA